MTLCLHCRDHWFIRCWTLEARPILIKIVDFPVPGVAAAPAAAAEEAV